MTEIDGGEFPTYQYAQFVAVYLGDEDGVPIIVTDDMQSEDIRDLISGGQRVILCARLRRLVNVLES